MRNKKKILVLILLVVLFLSIPLTAFAGFDEYGYNPQARMYKGTLENWEAFLYGLPPTDWDTQATDVIFVERKWDKLFDPLMSGSLPLGPGAWQRARLWEYLSGDKLGWTWHLDLKVVYSPENPIPGAIVLTSREMGIEGFYCVVQEEWLTGPKGEKVILQDLAVDPGIVNKAVKHAR